MRELLQDSIERILAEQITPALLQAGEAGQWPTPLFNLLDEGGFTRAIAAEDSGGVGASWSDVFPIVFASGRHALPLPVPDSLAACYLLGRCSLPAPAGVLGIGEAAQGASLTRNSQGWTFNGRISQVMWGRAADHVVTSVQHEGRYAVVLLSRQGASVRQDMNTAREPRDDLSYADAAVQAMAPWPASTDIDPVRLFGALIRAGQLAGAMEAAVALSVRYANDRIQFGKPIGKFQAIQQQLAVAASQAASVTAAAEYAFAMATQDQAQFAVTCAKQRAGEIAGNVAAIAHAVHGAIGFTYEHSLHYLTRRLWAWRSEYGTHNWWAERLGRGICQTGGASLWAQITAQSVQAS